MRDRWLLLVYRIPPEPSRHRVATWRRLKEAGAVYLQSSVCILPDGPEGRQVFRDLSASIAAAGGESLLFSARVSRQEARSAVVGKFNAERDAEYGELLEQCDAFLEEIRRETARENFTYAELEENEGNLQRLQAWSQKIRQRDYFGAPLAAKAEASLLACQASLDEFANRVFAATN